MSAASASAAAAASASASLSLFLTATIQLVTCVPDWRYNFTLGFKSIPPCDESDRTSAGSELLLLTRRGSGCVRRNDENSAVAAGFLSEGKNLVFIHDRGGNARQKWIESAQDFLASCKYENFNSFAFNWDSTGVNAHKFEKMSAAAADLHHFLLWLELISLHVNMADFHLIGLGYGAIVAGVAAKSIRRGGSHVGRITGLDPPNVKTEFQLQPTDADFVDVIRTTGGDKVELPLTGHAEFIVNGAQSHRLYAAFLFVKSLDYGEYLAKRCDNFEKFKTGGCGICSRDCVLMGYRIRRSDESKTENLPSDIARKIRGRYYTLTVVHPRRSFLSKSVDPTTMIIFNMTVTSKFSGSYTADLFVNNKRNQLIKKQQQFNRTFTGVTVINAHPVYANFEMKISVVKPTLPRLVGEVSFDMQMLETGCVKSMCMRKPPVNSKFFLTDLNCLLQQSKKYYYCTKRNGKKL